MVVNTLLKGNYIAKQCFTIDQTKMPYKLSVAHTSTHYANFFTDLYHYRLYDLPKHSFIHVLICICGINDILLIQCFLMNSHLLNYQKTI